ncbi:MAG TPA: sensor histidine kinase [Verrucomicrobiae bacterium]|nr:sensor histidine kinase [Verrucomicrobiae bacterium]
MTRFSIYDLLSDRRALTRSARMLCVILLSLMIAVTIGECVEIVLLPMHVFHWLAILTVVDGGGLALLEMNERGHTRAASKLLVIGLALLITVSAATGGGMHTPAATYYLTLVFIAGLLLGRPWAVLTAIFCCFGGLGLVVFARTTNLPANEVRNNAIGLWIGTMINMAIIIGLQYFAARTARRALEQVRALSSRLVSLREDERTRIAREVHDHLGQLLTALKMELHSAQTSVSSISRPELREKLTQKMGTATTLSNDLIHSVQKIASELRPGALDCLGLDAAIESEAETFESRTNVRCECNVPVGELSIPDAHATAVFRIFQEILTNIARHAQATLVVISLIHEDDNLLLDVEDNGIGMSEDRISDPNSLGILGMQERAEALGGRVVFRRNRRGGTTVSVRIPLPDVPAAAEESEVFHPTFVEAETKQSVA